MVDLTLYGHIGLAEKRKNQLSNLGISHLMLISIQVKNSLYWLSKSFIAIIYIVIIYYPKKITWIIFIPFVSWKDFLIWPRIKQRHNCFKKTFKSRHKCFKKTFSFRNTFCSLFRTKQEIYWNQLKMMTGNSDKTSAKKIRLVWNSNKFYTSLLIRFDDVINFFTSIKNVKTKAIIILNIKNLWRRLWKKILRKHKF